MLCSREERERVQPENTFEQRLKQRQTDRHRGTKKSKPHLRESTGQRVAVRFRLKRGCKHVVVPLGFDDVVSRREDPSAQHEDRLGGPQNKDESN